MNTRCYDRIFERGVAFCAVTILTMIFRFVCYDFYPCFLFCYFLISFLFFSILARLESTIRNDKNSLDCPFFMIISRDETKCRERTSKFRRIYRNATWGWTEIERERNTTFHSLKSSMSRVRMEELPFRFSYFFLFSFFDFFFSWRK